MREPLARALIGEGSILSALGRAEEGVRRFDEAIARIGASEDAGARELMIKALTLKGSSLPPLGRAPIPQMERTPREVPLGHKRRQAGRDHRRWYLREVPGLFADALRGVKAELDPSGIMNPGVLLEPRAVARGSEGGRR